VGVREDVRRLDVQDFRAVVEGLPRAAPLRENRLETREPVP
jgi:hypothetical protein